jgi:hypothetical protein
MQQATSSYATLSRCVVVAVQAVQCWTAWLADGRWLSVTWLMPQQGTREGAAAAAAAARMEQQHNRETLFDRAVATAAAVGSHHA